MSKTTLLYKDIAVGAENDATVTSGSAIAFSDLAALPHGTALTEPIVTTEPNRWALDGRFVLRGSQRPAFWSSALSGDNGFFGTPPVITISFDRQYSSLGVSLTFEPETGEYCSQVNIKWYQGTTLKADVDFVPDSPSYYCEQRVESYDKIIITLQRTSRPQRRARLEWVQFGVERTFDMSELRNAAVVAQVDLISAQLAASTLRWTLDSRQNVDYMFQLKQPIEVRCDDALLGVFYIDGFSRTAQSVYTLDCYDAVGVLGESPFAGGVYSGKSAKALTAEIVGADFAVDFGSVQDAQLTGILLPASRREALQQVLFAWGVCAATDGCAGLRIFTPGTAAANIGPERTYTGASLDTAAVVTEVRVTAHTYTQDSSGSVDIGGVKYRDTEQVFTVKNPDVTASDKQNVVEITGATLVSPSIGQAVAQRVYGHYQKRGTARAKIVWQGERLGQRVTLPSPWGTGHTGNLTRLDFRLSNTVAAAAEAVGN